MNKKQKHSKNRFSGLMLMVIFMVSYPMLHGGTLDPEMKKFEPFIGQWKTTSVVPKSGKKIPGELEYSWVLGKNWIKVEFKGHHPEREYWEAYAMIRFDRLKNRYRSFDFFNDGDPVIMSGEWISPDTVRFEARDEIQHWGIDYTVRTDGSIFQENWQTTGDGQRKITLQTEYQKAEK